MKDEKHTTHDQHESTLRSSCTRSAFPSIGSSSQLCSWLTHPQRASNKVGRNFRPFFVGSIRFLTKPPSKLPPQRCVEFTDKRLSIQDFDRKFLLQPCKSVEFGAGFMTGFASFRLIRKNYFQEKQPAGSKHFLIL